MSDVLVRIKRAVLAGRYRFSEKARSDMDRDALNERDVVEAVLGASSIRKRIRSTSPFRGVHKEYLYVIEGRNLEGLLVYTKGKFVSEEGGIYYFLISSKRLK